MSSTPQQSMVMGLNEFQAWTKTTRVYHPEIEREYLALQIASESGEVCGAFSKMLRGDAAINYRNVIKELGDLLWAIGLTLDMYGYDLKAVCDQAKPRVKIRTQKSAEMASLDLNERCAKLGTNVYYDGLNSANIKAFSGVIEIMKKLADFLGTTLEGIAWANWDKLTDRQNREVIHDNGLGDNR